MDKERLKRLAADSRFVSGIHNYCDRWCERCEFTSQCSCFAIERAEFGSGDARDVDNAAFWKQIGEIFAVTLEMLTEKAEELGVDLDAVRAAAEEKDTLDDAADRHPLCRCAMEYADQVRNWFERCEPVFKAALRDLESRIEMEIEGDEPEKEFKGFEDAVEVIRWYQHLIFVKLVRAVRGLLEFAERSVEYVTGDSEASAKVALIGMDRSIAAWGRLLGLLPEEEDAILDILVRLERLRRWTEQLIPGARLFVRPGLDE